MLVRLGQPRGSEGVVALLVACHERIRTFLGMARLLATAQATGREIAEAAGQIRRYFAEAFPLHTADEDDSIAPRLARDASAAPALAVMRRDHDAHAPRIASLVQLCAAAERDPDRLPAIARELGAAAAALTAELEVHLALEERAIFPAILRLPEAEQEAIRREIRARRRPGA
jgi:iron-sulfur cluster repair protein YtfE (RIC family)